MARWDWKPTKEKADREKAKLEKRGYKARVAKSKAGGYYIHVSERDVAELLRKRK